MVTTRRTAQANAVRRPPRLGDEVYHSIYSMLMGQKILPGARISIDSLARDLSVSQTPIREALSRLEAQGLVVNTHLIGFSAAPQMTRPRFDQLYEVRLLLEPFAARKAATLISFDQYDRLRQIHTDMSGNGKEGRISYSRFASLDSDFHMVIAEASGNELVREALGGLHMHVHLFRLAQHPLVTPGTLAEHADLLDAFSTGNPDRVETVMREHINQSYDRFSSVFR